MSYKYTTTLTAALAAMVLLGGCQRPKMDSGQPPQGPVPVTFETVSSGDLEASLQATGQTQAMNTVQVYPRVAGYIKQKNYTEGSKVSKGQLLFTIDPADMMNARNAAKASLGQAQANFVNAQATLARIKPLADANAASKQDLDTALANERSTAAAVQVAKANLAQAELNLQYTKIKAPVSGYTDKTKIDLGTYVSVGGATPLTTVYQTDPMYVNFSFSEGQKLALQDALKNGTLVAHEKNTFGITLSLSDGTTVSKEGKVDFAAPFYDTTTGTMSYRATFTNPDNRLVPGQFVRVALGGLTWKNVVYVPQKAVLTNLKGKYVYVYAPNNTVTTRQVIIGAWSGQNVIVSSGLKAGDKVAVDHLTALREGAPVTPLKAAVAK